MKAEDTPSDARPHTRVRTYAGLGLVVGTAVALGLGLILWLVTGQPLYLLLGGMGTGVGLLLGAGIDATNRDESSDRQSAAEPLARTDGEPRG